MPVQSDKRPVPDLLVERLAAGELSATMTQAVRARLEAEPGGLERLAAIRSSNDAILARYTTDDMVAAIARKRADADRIEAARADQAKRSSPSWMAWGAPAMLAAIVAVVALRGGPGAVDSSDLSPVTDKALPTEPAVAGGEPDDGHRSKGLRAHLQVFRKRGVDVERLHDGQQAAAGDVIQLRYIAGDASHGAILSIDGRGEVTMHYPESEDGETELEPGKAIALPHAYELDDAPRFERFVFVTSSRPIDLQQILEAARGTSRAGARAENIALDLPAGLWQSSFVVKKVQP